MEFAGPAPVGPFATLAAEMPLRKPNDVKQVDPGTRPGNTAPDTGRDRDNGTEAAAARDIRALRREMERRDLPAGPSPAFEVSQLEMDADIQQVIARVEAARAQAREAGALKPEEKAVERPAEAEASDRAEPVSVGQLPRDRTDTAPQPAPANTAAASSGARAPLDAKS